MRGDRVPYKDFAKLIQLSLSTFQDEIDFSRENLVDQVEHPIRFGLMERYLSLLEVHINTKRAILGAIEKTAKIDEVLLLLNEDCGQHEMLAELQKWFRTNGTTLIDLSDDSRASGDVAGDVLVSMGYSFSKTQAALRNARKQRKGGTPPRYRLSTVEALEMMQSNSSISMQQIADKFCGVAKEKHRRTREHRLQCPERMRKRLEELKAVLKKFKINLGEN